MKVIFILGSGHCGSTLLDMVLDSHSKIAGVGEIHTMKERMVCTCGKAMENCPFWQSATKEVGIKQLEIYRNKVSALFNGDNFLFSDTRNTVEPESFIKENEQIFKNIINYARASAVVDSSKNADRVALLSKSSAIEPIVIHLVRDGRAVTWSYVRKYKNFPPQILKWFLSNIKIELLKHRLIKAKFIFVRYEDLIKNTEVEIKKILKSANLPYEEGLLEFREGEHHQIGGNNMRFRSEGISSTADEKWKKDMPFWQRIVFNTMFGWLNVYYRNK